MRGRQSLAAPLLHARLRRPRKARTHGMGANESDCSPSYVTRIPYAPGKPLLFVGFLTLYT